MKTTAQIVTEVNQLTDKAAAQWMAEHRNKIPQMVSSMLERRMEEVVAKLLGFDNHWGDWAVDHCNGRAGNSAAGDWLREQARDAIKAWLTAQAGKLPTLPKHAIESLRKNYQKTLERELRTQLVSTATHKARELLFEITGKDDE